MAAAASASPPEIPGASPVDVDFGFRGIVSDEAVRVEDKCFVSIEFLKKVDWAPLISGMDCQIHDDGRTVTVPLYSIGGRRTVCLNEVAKELQAKAYYPQNSDTFYFKAAVSEVAATASGLIVRTSTRVRPMVTLSTTRLTLDLKGAEFEPGMAAALPPGWKLAYVNLDTVRLSIEHPALSNYSTPRLTESRAIKLALPDAVVASALRGGGYMPARETSRGGSVQRIPDGLPDVPVEAAPTYRPARPAPPIHTSSQAMPPLSSPGGFDLPVPAFGPLVSEVNVTGDDSEHLTLFVASQNLAPGAVSVNYRSPTQIMVVFSGAQWKRMGDVAKQTNLAKAITKTTVNGMAALSIVTEVPLVFNVSALTDSVGIRLTKPRGGGLSRKVIVIDPGHGGHDNGCTYAGLQEKQMTLGVSLAVAQRLQREGASVVMTRSDDSYPTLTRRAEIANQSYADAFLSIHINSLNGSAPSASMTFYHGTSGVSHLLAECVQSEMASVSSIGNWGTVNDFKRFREGMAVLRMNTRPAVLMELGFINNSRDRSEMTAADFPDRMAEAITRGLRKFFGGQG